MRKVEAKSNLAKKAADGVLFVLNGQIDLVICGQDDGNLGVGVDLSMWKGDLVITPRFGQVPYQVVKGGDIQTAWQAIRHLDKRSATFREQFKTTTKQNDLMVRVLQMRDNAVLTRVTYA